MLIRNRLMRLIFLLIAAGAVSPSFGAPVSSLSITPAFESNDGQFATGVLFGIRLRTGNLLLTSRGIEVDSGSARHTMRFVGASPAAKVEGLDQLPEKVHYLIGNDPGRWRRTICRYEKVEYRQLYPGIDAVFYVANGQVEYDLMVGPTGDVSNVRLDFGPGNDLSIGETGDLVARRGTSLLRHQRPAVWAAGDVSRTPIPARYVIRRNRYVSVEAERRPGLPIVIDPRIEFSTYIGGRDGEVIEGITCDAAGNVYVVGQTFSSDLPLQKAAQNSLAGGSDLLVARFNVDGTLAWLTYLGGSAKDIAYGGPIAVNTEGELFVGGATASKDFPITTGKKTRSGSTDAFIVKFDASGEKLLWSAGFGGGGADAVTSLALRDDGTLFATGYTSSSDLQLVKPLHEKLSGLTDAFIAGFGADGAVVFSSYFGGTNNDYAESGESVAVGDDGSVFFGGNTRAKDFPATASIGVVDEKEQDIFVARIAPDLSAVTYATRIGGSARDAMGGIAVAGGGVFIAGETKSSDFPTKAALQPALKGDSDVFVLELADSGVDLVYSTYIGGTAFDGGSPSIAVDSSGQAVVAGTTYSSDFPLSSSARPLIGVRDAFVARLDRSGALGFSTLIGGNEVAEERATGVAADRGAAVLVCGSTSALDFPVNQAVQNELAGLSDGFVMKLIPDVLLTGDVTALIPVVGSTASSAGVEFRTALQLHNPGTSWLTGRLVFHPQGIPADASDPSLSFSLAPGETHAFADVLASMGTSGLGSLDVISTATEPPVSFVRVYAASGKGGTNGTDEELISAEAALKTGERGVLIAPSDPARQRFNIGVRTLSAGAALTVTVRDIQGNVVRSLTKSYPVNYFLQTSDSEFFGAPLGANHSAVFAVDSGSAVVYGATTDNITQDAALQLAAAPAATAETRIIPLLQSGATETGAFWKTAVQLHNASAERAAGRLVIYAKDCKGCVSLAYSLDPGQTSVWHDVLAAVGITGTATADLVPESGPAPVIVVRLCDEQNSTGTAQPAVAAGSVVRGGGRAVLIVPPELSASQFTIGLRSLGRGFTMHFTIKSAAGVNVPTNVTTVIFNPNGLFLGSASELGIPRLQANDTITFHVDSGEMLVFGLTRDNESHDSALQLPKQIR